MYNEERKRRIDIEHRMHINLEAYINDPRDDSWSDFFEVLDEYIDFNIELAFKSKEDDSSFYY